jgi:hypothetical protein
VRLSLQPIQYLRNVNIPSLLLFMKIFCCMLFSCCRQWAFIHFHAWSHPTKVSSYITIYTKAQRPLTFKKVQSVAKKENFPCLVSSYLPFRKCHSAVQNSNLQHTIPKSFMDEKGNLHFHWFYTGPETLKYIISSKGISQIGMRLSPLGKLATISPMVPMQKFCNKLEQTIYQIYLYVETLAVDSIEWQHFSSIKL